MPELIYTIDKVRSEQDNALVIKIQPAERDGYVLQPIKQPPPLTREKLQTYADAKDASILPFLIKEECSYAKKHFGRVLTDKDKFEFIHIPYSQTGNALKLFATNGKLFFNDKQLVIDLFGKNEFYYTADSSLGSPVAKGMIKTSTQDFPVETCDFFGRGPPHYYVKGINLKFITTDISWQDLKLSAAGQPRPLQTLLQESKEDPDAPPVQSSEPLALSPREPFPILVLKDRLGSFADLWMDYGDGSIALPIHDPSETVKNGGKPFCKRHHAAEKGWEKDLLETDYIKKTVDTSHYYCPLDKVSKSIAFLLEIGWHVRDASGNAVLQHHHTEMLAESYQNDLLIKGKMHYGNFQADLSTIIGAFNRRERFAEIAPGHVALLPNSLEQAGLDAITAAGEVIGDAIRLKRNHIGSLTSLFDAKPDIGLDTTLEKLKNQLENFQGIAQALPGSTFCGTLRPYQQEGLSWLNFLYDFHFHGMLADDMGLGKTVQVLAFISRLSLSSPILIIVPTSLIFNWKKEIERFLPTHQLKIHHGPQRATKVQDLSQTQLLLTTYTTARLDVSLLAELSYTCLILDEAQAIKNAHTQTFQTVTRFSSAFRLSITGTPVENKLLELWSHFRFLIPDLFSDESAFMAELQAGSSDPRFIKRIKRKIRPFLLRRTKDEVAKDLPEKIEQTVWIDMQPKQRAVYEQFLTGVRSNLIKKVNTEGTAKHRIEILEAIMRLRQICCHPLLVSTGEDDETNESAKLDALMQDLETAREENRKVLVYSQFTSMLALIGKRLKSEGLDYLYLDGSTQNREKVVTQFQEDPTALIFLISLKAGGIGLNLTAADYVFLYDPWWNAAIENQAIDRAHRIGRKETVIAKRYIIAESIEEKMMKLKSAKSALAADILDDEGQAASALTTEDLLFLLN